MKTIQTKPDCTLGFAKFDNDRSYTHKNVLYSSGLGSSSVTYLDKDALTWLRDHNYPNLNWIGRLSEITEDQAKELVEVSVGGFLYKQYYFTNHSTTQSPIHYSGETGVVSLLRALSSLQSAALSVGIEEKDFDKYLVIKL